MTDYSTGECPADEPVGLIPEDLYLKRAAERGRHEIVLGSIRAHLEEQPTPSAVAAAVRHWISDLTALGDEVAKTKQRPPS
ncbi:hypothetical protein SCAB_48531 [Streptomyces scabiei 87.22]|uniref:Uncharacterized protein n=1 Tax=Streptomyces scabiei (strain 87.22) TaxID=680198 RepID=C9ZFB8_STRSW|nr:hypothetical protein [Streptomyces scabiei]MDX2891444.1 hypothetical protein [Streptomyces scabiei]MDX2904893.1 hypothetical protein [Streptomyces scabiei]MDX2994492.1 hypothetical protein [Streptomyces scabiei]MDX3084736.1 hypothetical protein [Streptomyces scabiei]MDX3137864.1 hypothetical protein [Streptomyces scabiei]